jgi:hypothetical protein
MEKYNGNNQELQIANRRVSFKVRWFIEFGFIDKQ